MVEDSQAPLIVTDAGHLPAATTLVRPGVQILDVETLGAGGATDDLDLALSGDTLAYILYTSGSTGQAKGVVQPHRNVLHKIMLQTNTYRIGPDDRLSMLHSCSSNASVRHL